MYQVPKARRLQQVRIQQYLYLINIGLYSLAIYLSIFTAENIVGWWLDDPRYDLNFASFIWFPIGLLLLNPLIWQQKYTPTSLGILTGLLILINGFMFGFMQVDVSDADQLGWAVVTLLSAMFAWYACYRARPWRKLQKRT
ncbi:hypothetical protein [Herpetosiphon giganteus]|uniref:hypothetical protein n=1 Tax=Herpetosiphon giganteus TaxID=2029754 RepID=UPI0019564D93|nr:hypothetical protein [Herpetosiphon giganteus]MBM7842135.1 hypothetical protein [Herpetosiphon giganteus]